MHVDSCSVIMTMLMLLSMAMMAECSATRNQWRHVRVHVANVRAFTVCFKRIQLVGKLATFSGSGEGTRMIYREY